MSKIVRSLTAVTRTPRTMKRAIDHSPGFPTPDEERREGRPAIRLPPGGSLTG